MDWIACYMKEENNMGNCADRVKELALFREVDRGSMALSYALQAFSHPPHACGLSMWVGLERPAQTCDVVRVERERERAQEEEEWIYVLEMRGKKRIYLTCKFPTAIFKILLIDSSVNLPTFSLSFSFSL